MSNPLERRMIEDKMLRDAALALVKADVAQLRADLNVRNLGNRALDRVSEGATDILDEAVDLADNNRGVVAALVAALVVWFARNPILALFDRADDENHYDAAQGGAGETREDLTEPDEA